ncbi:luciferase domain-containing protein [Blastococcus sp. SYSU D00813]
MTTVTDDAERRLTALADALAGEPGVELPGAGGGPRRFGSTALKVDGSIVAMAVGGALVLKLPRARVEALLADGAGTPFRNGRGAAMREWVALGPDDAADLALAREALAFVRQH